MATQKKSALAKLLAVLIAVILIFSSLVAVLFAYTWFAFRSPYVNVTPSPFMVTPSPTPSIITPSPSTSSPTESQPPTSTPTAPSTGTPTPTPTVVTLADAISQGLVQATFSGKGSCAGDCIKLTIQSQVTYPIEITPPALGTVLTTSSSGAQSMVLQQLQGIDHGSTYTPTTTILLTNQTLVTYMFRAYCLDFHKANPSSSDQFTMTGTANSDVIKVLNAAATQPASVASITAVQTAIWVVTNNISQQDLSKTFPSGLNEINNTKTILQAAGIDITGKALFAAPTAT
jgi:hypothetical protein